MWALLPVEVDAAHALPVDTATGLPPLTGRQSVYLAVATVATEVGMTRVDVTISGAQDSKPLPARIVTSSAVSTPAVTVSNPGGAGTDWGWDTSLWTAPPLLTGGGDASKTGDVTMPWHTNVGLWDPAVLASLTTVASFTTSSANQHVEGLKITGAVNVNHAGVIFKNCWLVCGSNGSTSSRTVVADTLWADPASHPRFYGCDIGSTNRSTSPGDQGYTWNRGPVHAYRCNIFGVLDGIQIWASGQVLQNNFIHDMSNGYDVGQPDGTAHNDAMQFIPSGGAHTGVVMRKNTRFCWSYYAQGTSQGCTRSSGPNWYKPATTSDSGGYMTGGMQADDNTNGCTIDGDLFRGSAAHYINLNGGAATKNNFVVKNCRFSSTESPNSPSVGNPSVWRSGSTNNLYWAGDPRAGQAV